MEGDYLKLLLDCLVLMEGRQQGSKHLQQINYKHLIERDVLVFSDKLRYYMCNVCVSPGTRNLL